MVDRRTGRDGPYAGPVVLGWVCGNWEQFDPWCLARGIDLHTLTVARALSLYLYMLREWADKKRVDEIERALRPPASWRDPDTGLPAGWDTEDDEWALWQSSTKG